MQRYRTYNLPTEYVVRDPGFYAPQQGRIYHTDLFVTKLQDRQLVVDRNKLYEIGVRVRGEQFHGVYDMGEELFMVEHYEDHGDDGHTEMALSGYIFVTAKDLELVEVYGRKQFAYVEELQAREMAKWRSNIESEEVEYLDEVREPDEPVIIVTELIDSN
jgi:hypothetical protein